MSLIDHIGSVEAAINLTKNPDSRNHLMSILTLLYQAKELWLEVFNDARSTTQADVVTLLLLESELAKSEGQ